MAFNVVPVLIVLLIVWLAAIFILPIPTWIWWAMLAAVVSFYGPISDAIVWRLCRKEREAEIKAQTKIIDAHLARRAAKLARAEYQQKAE
jgi:hypothetical protein